MIISHRHKFIFIKNMKTAGTSIEIALADICGDEDIVTNLVKKDEAKRKRKGKRYIINGNHYFNNHAPVSTIRIQVAEQFGTDIWSNYYKFCVERNPWDKVISYYYFLKSRTKSFRKKSLNSFIHSECAYRCSNYERYTINGSIAVNRILRFENLQQEFNDVCKTLGIAPLNLPRAKVNGQRPDEHYRELIGPKEKNMIAKAFEMEIDLLEYKF